MLALLLAPLLSLLPPTTTQALPEMRPADQVPLAVDVFEAHGGVDWATVKRLRYTFRVEENGVEKLAAEHDWDKQEGRVTVKVNDGEPMETGTADGEGEAFSRWTNDAYWLVAPLKLLDPGVNAAELEPLADGTRQLLVGFGDVGMTPEDTYLYEIEPDTHLVRAWTYMPDAETKRRFEWSGYERFGPLTLSTDHVTAAGFRVHFTDVEVE